MSTMTTGPAMNPPPPSRKPISLTKQLIFWACAFLVLAALLWLLNEVLLPFIAGMVLAYLLDPSVRRLQKLGLNRTLASVVIVVLVIVLLTLGLILLLPALGEQIAGFMEKLPQYMDRVRQLAQEQSQGWLGQFVGEKLPEAQKSLGGVASSAAGWIAAFLGSIWSGGKALVSVISLLIITPIVAFYLLLDWERMIVKVDSWIPLQHKDTVRGLAREMDAAISGFVRGQALVCLILGVIYSVGLIAIGVNFGLLIGLIAAFLSFAPYIGTITGFILAVGVALAQFWPDWTMPAAAAGIFIFGQFIEGNILQPLLVGKEIGLHPVWLMFSLIAFGVLFGFVGLLVAVPVAAAIGVLVRFMLRQYLASPFYTGNQQG
ncbi:AI-2E family transporter [Pseudorhodoplanes sinuspersici]|nr:AI-2E family transporter [Pseudorhodoplanes sinuspersici]RKE73916.1 putative PurR-regulated permease PerM [Pseudorhodoplanes sinuspersici]